MQISHVSAISMTLLPCDGDLILSAFSDASFITDEVSFVHAAVLVQLSLRRQQVSEKLNEWTVFSEKYKELCEWLTNMESKVSQNGDISIEEMIEKLRRVGRQSLLSGCLNQVKFGRFSISPF